jgi:hypothetical protein
MKREIPMPDNPSSSDVDWIVESDIREVDNLLDEHGALEREFRILEYKVAKREHDALVAANGGRWVTNPPTPPEGYVEE